MGQRLARAAVLDSASFGVEIGAEVAYLRENHYQVKQYPSFKQDTTDHKRNWNFFLLAKDVELTIWAVENGGMTYDFKDQPILSQLPFSIVFESLENAKIHSYHVTQQGKVEVCRFKLLRKLKFLESFLRHDVYWYLGPSLSLTKQGLKLFMAMIADKNERRSSVDDRLTEFYKDFVTFYFEILNGENKRGCAEKTATLDAALMTIDNWSKLNREKEIKELKREKEKEKLEREKRNRKLILRFKRN